jgi:NADPH-dependent glutamate synthase beta subunit-like oxidoreductase/Pyruvate/2-oxoacid:ferredoxin oxidoreductase delta subunit
MIVVVMAKEEVGKQISHFTFRRFKDGDDKWLHMTDRIFSGDTSHKCPIYVHRTPPCQGSCPSGEDIRGWLDIVRGLEKPPNGVSMQEYAFRRATNANPFPSVMGRVCPAPCEDGCNRNQLEDHVGINSVEQYIGDSALKAGFKFVAGTDTGKRVAIIGGGPAGLAAAYQLRRRGHACTIFDEHSQLGGMMTWGIPGYRMPRNVLLGEINRILDMGVEVRFNTRVGRDIALSDLEQDYDAIVVAIGAQRGRALPVEGADAPNCLSGIAFLDAFNDGRLKAVTGRVIVVGGGDTSVDVATVARRLGHVTTIHEKDRPEHIIINQTAHDVIETAARQGADVLLLSRSPIHKMSAAKHEVEDALREGVEIQGSIGPVEVIKGSDGRATHLRVQRLTETTKAPIPNTEMDLECDIIVAAIGQGGSLEGMESFNNGRGLINTDRHFQIPNRRGYFAIGDIVKPHLLTTVIGQATVAVESIDKYLAGIELSKRPKVDVRHFDLMDKLQEVGLQPEEYNHKQVWGTSESKFAVHNYEDRASQEVIPADMLFLGHFKYMERNKRGSHHVDSTNVIGNFMERMIPLSEHAVVEEAKRCMSCGMCFECDNCVIFCPQEAVKKTPKNQATTGRYVYTDYARCIGCHICAEVCPTGYIQMGMGE